MGNLSRSSHNSSSHNLHNSEAPRFPQLVVLQPEPGLNKRLRDLQTQLDAGVSAYGDSELEQLANRVRESVRALQDKPCDRTVAVFLGMPGVGKSTQAALIAAHFQAPRYHLGRFSTTVELPPELRGRVDAQRASGNLVEGLSDLFLDTVAASSSDVVVLDGFPRAPADAVRLLDFAERHRWRLVVVSMCFERGEEAFDSLNRQISRYQSRFTSETPIQELERFLNKVERMVDHSAPAISVLERGGCEVHKIVVGDRDLADINCQIHSAIRTGFSHISWDSRILHEVESARIATGVDAAFVACGAFYRPFFNNRFGPPSDPADVHVGVMQPHDATTMRDQLAAQCSQIRFKVQPVPQLLEALFDTKLTELSPVQVLQASPMVWLQGAVRMEQGRVNVMTTPECLSDLRAGILRLDEEILSSFTPEVQSTVIEKACRSARQLVSSYSGLRLVGALARAYEQVYGEHIPIPYCADPVSVETQVLSKEQEHGGRSHWKVGILPEECASAERAMRFILALPRTVTAVPIPAPAKMPGLLGEIQDLKRTFKDEYASHQGKADDSYKRIHPAPAGYASWLHFVCEQGSDAQWREWLLNQWKSSHPYAGRDPWVTAVLGLDVQDAMSRSGIPHASNLGGKQKQTHRGVSLSLHLLWSALSLDTGPTVEAMRRCNASKHDIEQVRGGMRLGALGHDLGKLAGEAAVYTPGVHGVLGQRIWDEVRPHWVGDISNQIARWCVGYHDLLGRLSRGLTEKILPEGTQERGVARFDIHLPPSYRGAYDPSSIRTVLKQLPLPYDVSLLVCRDIWRSDVAAVPGLRWLLPAAEYLIEVVRSRNPEH